jgi:hypothetical protein
VASLIPTEEAEHHQHKIEEGVYAEAHHRSKIVGCVALLALCFFAFVFV